MLHLVTSNLPTSDFNSLLLSVGQNDAVVLLNDGVYLAKQWHDIDKQCYVMAADAKIRGLNIPHNLQQIDMAMLVQLTANHTNSATW